MEIAEFLHLRLRRIGALLLLAVAAALPTTALVVRSPPSYDGSVTVRLGALLPDGGAFYLWERLVQDYQVALRLPEVAEQAGAATGVPAGKVQSGLSTVLPQKGDVIVVQFRDADAARSADVARAAAVAALGVLADQDADQTTTTASVADTQLQGAIDRLERYTATVRPALPTVASGLAEQILGVERRAAAGTAAPEEEASLPALRAQAATLLAAAPQYSALEQAVATAQAASKQATFDEVAARATAAAASTGTLVTITGVQPVSRLLTVVTAGLGAGALVVLLAVGALAARELRRPRDARRVHPHRVPLLDRLAAAPPVTFRLAWVAVLPVAVATTYGLSMLAAGGKTALALALALPVGAVAGVLAVTRFEAFLLACIATRASLDALSLGSASSNSVDPGVMLGGVFIVSATLWLLAQRRSGQWVPASRATLALWGFAAACAISIPTSLAITTSVISTSKLVAGVLMFSVLEQYLGRHPERAGKVVRSVLASLALPALAGLKEWVSGQGNTYYVDVSRVSGTFVHPSSLANYLLLLLPLSALLVGWCRGRQRVVMAGIVFLELLLLVLTYTRTAWLAALVSAFYLVIRWRRELVWALVLGLVALVVAVPSIPARFADLNAPAPVAGVPSNSLSWRVGYWGRLIPEAAANPITGLGFDSTVRTSPEQLQPHNVFVQAYVETGLVGFVALLWVLWTFGSMLRARERRAASGWPRLLALAATAAAIATALQLPSENLVTQTVVFWYLAAAMTFGHGAAAARAASPAPVAAPAPAVRARSVALAGSPA